MNKVGSTKEGTLIYVSSSVIRHEAVGYQIVDM